MSFWTWLTGSPSGETPNGNPASSVGPSYDAGDPNGVVYDPGPPVVNTRFASLSPSPWSGWPAEWGTPEFSQKATPLVDTAWTCIDLNSSILATMPTYRKRNGIVLDPLPWMQNPDDLVYESWAEFAKSLFWNYQGSGEAFVYCMGRNAQGLPVRFREIPPHMIRVEMAGANMRRYFIGETEIDPLATRDLAYPDLLHIRYKSDPFCPRGQGPLDAVAPRVVVAGLLTRLVGTITEQGGVPPYWLEVDKQITRPQATELLDEWVDARIRNSGRPALLSQGVTAKTMPFSTKEMALLELGQWTESRIAIALGVPPFLAGLPSGGDSLTYANVSMLFDFHDRSSLRPKAKTVMAALSNWLLPRGQCVELDSEEYTRPDMVGRSQAYANWNMIPGAIGGADVRQMEQLEGDPPPAVVPEAAQQGGTGA